jgi:hypothetical protein
MTTRRFLLITAAGLCLLGSLNVLAQTAQSPMTPRAAKRTSLDRPTVTDAQAKRQYFIILQSSSDPSVTLRASIPADLQNSEVFTSSRNSERVTLYDFNLGYFATLEEAEHAQRILLRRFPDASIVHAQLTELKKAVKP